MKRLVLIIISLIVTCCQLQAKDKEGTIAFSKTSFNFGTFQKSTIRKCVFPFKNTGNAPISISAAEATCNCTTATYTKSPIMPGKTGYVTIYYNGRNYGTGHFRKTVDIRSTASNGLVRLVIEGITK